MMCKNMYKQLLAYFYDVINGLSVGATADKNNAIACVNNSCADVRIVDGVFQFTLRGLYTQLCDDKCTHLGTYASFRSMVYASELNKDLSNVGYLVQVHYSTGKVDSSWYELVVLPHKAACVLD